MPFIPPTNPLEPDKPKPKWRAPRQQRGYDETHYRLKRQCMLDAGGICESCQRAWAQELDHKDRNVFNMKRENLWVICRTCHLRKTATERFNG